MPPEPCNSLAIRAAGSGSARELRERARPHSYGPDQRQPSESTCAGTGKDGRRGPDHGHTYLFRRHLQLLFCAGSDRRNPRQPGARANSAGHGLASRGGRRGLFRRHGSSDHPGACFGSGSGYATAAGGDSHGALAGPPIRISTRGPARGRAVGELRPPWDCVAGGPCGTIHGFGHGTGLDHHGQRRLGGCGYSSVWRVGSGHGRQSGPLRPISVGSGRRGPRDDSSLATTGRAARNSDCGYSEARSHPVAGASPANSRGALRAGARRPGGDGRSQPDRGPFDTGGPRSECFHAGSRGLSGVGTRASGAGPGGPG